MFKRMGWTALLVFLAVLVIITLFSHFFTDMWWFGQLGFAQTFWLRLGWLWAVRLGAAIIAALFIYLNLSLTRRSAAQAMFRMQDRLQNISWRAVRWGYALAAIALGVLYGMAAASNWDKIALFINGQSFGIADPIFHKDVGFYVFQMPFYSLVHSLGMGLLIISLIAVGVVYLFTGAFQLEGFRLRLTGSARWHMSILLASILGFKAWGYILNLYNLLSSPTGVVYGATYTNMVANRPALYIMAVLAALIGLAILINAFRPGAARWIVVGLVTLGVSSFLLGSVYPGLVQKVRVDPNQLKLEQPYVGHHIAMTRVAYGLDKVIESDFNPSSELTAAMLNENSGTVKNIRQWDWQALLKVYRQLQEFKNYYRFSDMDIDRYTINGVYTQVMIAPRELYTRGLPTPNWINQHLVYTHGYGVVASPVNRVTAEGMPEYLLSNIPPTGVEELSVTRPEIYYGEIADRFNPYVIVNTNINEFDYPKGDMDVYTEYTGHGGVPLNSPLRRLAFATRYNALGFILNTDIKANSRVMMYRNINERVKRIAPFFAYDDDPYVVIDEGKLYWIIDAYTTSNRFPYAQPRRVQEWGTSINYIRNSVKVVIDAYNGDVTFYLMDSLEPVAVALLTTYGLPYQTVDNMPEGLKAHLRYPEDMFEIQSYLYTDYHMVDTRVFYNRSDAWEVPSTANNSYIEPYYVIMRLPHESQEELIMLRPYTPLGKENMTAWLAARSDGENYGKLVLYKFPKQSLTYGPAQIEARIDQDGEISQLLTLWGQKGSDVIRGNLLVIPIANSLLYVEPIFLQAEKSQMPELKLVVAVHGAQVAAGSTLDEALERLVGGRVATSVLKEATSSTGVVSNTAARRLNEAYSRLESQLKSVSKALSELEKAIQTLDEQ